MSAQPSPLKSAAPLTPALHQQALLKTLSSQGPNIDEVASALLARELVALYPNLDIHPDSTLIVTPLWEVVDDDVFYQDMNVESLTDALLRQCLEKTKANYVEGEHFLTREPLSATPKHLEVSIEKIAQLLNELVPVFFVEFKEQQLAFWNATDDELPHWEALADGLRQALNVQTISTWDADHCAIAQAVSKYPNKHTRAIERPEFNGIQVCLIDIDTQADAKHLMTIGAAVMTGRYKERDVLLMYTVSYGYESFANQQALGSAISARLSGKNASGQLSWRLVEPEGNFFDHMAWALINLQLLTIEGLDLAEELAVLSSDSAVADAPDEAEQARLDQLQRAIPDWLKDASAQDLSAYSQHLIDLSTARDEAAQALFEIPSIIDFAEKKMREAMLADKTAKGADKLDLDTLKITRTDSLSAGEIVLPNPLSQSKQTLGEYALSNSPPYMASITLKKGQDVPAWLTPAYLTALAQKVDIGRVYPQLIQSKLLDDPVQAPRQKQLYQRQLRSLLPLLALECKVRKQGGVDERGYGYINELLSPTPNSRQPIVVRPLSLYIQHRLSSDDTVLNMFLIGPRDTEDGPCLLYRPLMSRPLLQFQSFQNLLYALHQPGELRDSVLAWLPTQVLSFNYSQYVFPTGLPSPWLVMQSLAHPLSLVEWSGEVCLSTTELTGDVFAAFFDANAKAMTELADRQSLSNAERRWTLLADTGWAVFNAASGFLNGYAGAAVWAWQIINELQQALDAYQRGDSLVEWTRLGDVLMTLAIMLAHQANQRRQTSAEIETPTVPTKPVVTLAAPVLTARSTVTAKGSLPHSEYATIAVDGSVPRLPPEQLSDALDSLQVKAPDLKDPDISVATPQDFAPLYQLRDKAFAQVDHRWFEVIEDADENVLICNPKQPSRTGPRLAHDHGNTWRIDTSLRLLGSGRSLKSQLRASRLAKTQRRSELEQQLKTLKAKEAPSKQALGAASVQDFATATSSAIEGYLSKSDELITLFEESLTQLQAWREAGGTAGYIQELFRLSTEQHMYLNLWISVEQSRYLKLLKQVKEGLGDELASAQTLTDNVTKMATSGNAMVAKLERLNASLETLPTAGANGILLAERLKTLSPRFTQWDIKANEISTLHELCVREQAAANMEQARLSVGFVVGHAALASKEVALMMREATGPAWFEEHAERLVELVEEYTSLSQRIDELPQDYPELTEPAHLQRLKALIGEFQQLAQEKLDGLLPKPIKKANGAQRRPVAGPSKPGPKVSVSKPKPRDLPAKAAGFPKQAPLEVIPPKPARPAIQTHEYRNALSVGINLDVETDDFIERTKKDALRPKRIPADMQDIFDQQAARLEQAADTLDKLNAEVASKGEELEVTLLPQTLRVRADQLRKEGVATRANMLKARKPRQADFQWMLSNKQVRVTRNDAGRTKTQQYKDYFQEYQIFDKDDQPLWVAHFHYPTLKTPASRFTAAHLKIADHYLKQLPAEVSKALSERTPWDNHLRKLSDPVLQAEFLKLEPSRR